METDETTAPAEEDERANVQSQGQQHRRERHGTDTETADVEEIDERIQQEQQSREPDEDAHPTDA